MRSHVPQGRHIPAAVPEHYILTSVWSLQHCTSVLDHSLIANRLKCADLVLMHHNIWLLLVLFHHSLFELLLLCHDWFYRSWLCVLERKKPKHFPKCKLMLTIANKKHHIDAVPACLLVINAQCINAFATSFENERDAQLITVVFNTQDEMRRAADTSPAFIILWKAEVLNSWMANGLSGRNKRPRIDVTRDSKNCRSKQYFVWRMEAILQIRGQPWRGTLCSF